MDTVNENKTAESEIDRVKSSIQFFLDNKDDFKQVDNEIDSIHFINLLSFFENDDDLEKSHFKFINGLDLDTLIIALIDYYSKTCSEFKPNELFRTNNLLNVLKTLYFITNAQFKNEHLFKLNKKLFEDTQLVQLLLSFLQNENFLNKKFEFFELEDYISHIMLILKKTCENLLIKKRLNIEISDLELIFKNFNTSSLSNEFKEVFRQTSAQVLFLLPKTLEKCLQNINSHLKASDIIINKLVYYDLFYVQNLLYNIYNLDLDLNLVNYSLFNKCIGKFKLIFKQFYKIRNELDFKNEDINFEQPNESAEVNEIKISIFYYMLLIMDFGLTGSIQFNFNMGKRELIGLFLSFLDDDKFVDSLAKTSINVVFMIIKCVYYMSKWCMLNKNEWAGLRSIDIMDRIRSRLRTSKNEHIKEFCCYSYVYLSFALENKIEDFEDLSRVVENLLESLNKTGNGFESKEPLTKIKLEFLADDGKTIFKHDVSNEKAPSTSIINILIRVSLNEKYRRLVFERSFGAVKAIVMKGNYVEKMHAMKLLAQLCKTDDIADAVLNDADLFKYIKDVSKGEF